MVSFVVVRLSDGKRIGPAFEYFMQAKNYHERRLGDSKYLKIKKVNDSMPPVRAGLKELEGGECYE